MGKIIFDEISVSPQEIKELMIPIRDANGNISHESKFVVNNDRLKKLLDQHDLDKKVKVKIHMTVIQMINSMNNTGVYLYIPDRFKPIIPILFCMDILTNNNFIKTIEG